MLKLVLFTGATQIHHLIRKGRIGHVEYWKAQCGETRLLRLDGGKGRKSLPIRTIVDGGIEVKLSQNNQLLKDWQPSQLRHVLPEPLIQWIENQRIHLGPQPYPLIKQFLQSLFPHVSKKLLVDSSALAQLVEGTQPQDFALVWELNRSLECIEGHYEGADRYLGMGWFQKGANIWPLKLPLSASLDAHLKNPVYSPQHATVLLESNISYLQQYLPTRAHFQVITDFVPQVVVHNVSSSAVTLALQCNYPQLLSTIRVPQGDFDALLADRTVIQFSREALTPVMTYLLQSSSAITLEGESIPLFIREQLPTMQRYHQISDDLAAKISQAHPVVSIPTLKPTVSLAHAFENGIGAYSITTTYKYQQHALNIDALLTAYQRSQRFVRQHGIWFEWPENARDFVDTVLQQRAAVLRLEEVMGFDTQRLALLPDQAPARTIKPVGATYVERARSLFMQLRQHGIPGGIVAPHQTGLTMMLEAAWKDLVRDNPQARILWVVPAKKRAVVASAIRSRHVTVASPETLREEPELVSHAWTLVIFQELDYLLEAEHASEICSKISWAWATFSIASKSALTPAILRVLHVPEKYCEQLGAHYLFDPLKGSVDIVASNRSAELSRAQKESGQSEMEKPAVSGSTAIPDAFGRSDEAQREKIAQYLEMLKQNRLQRAPVETSSKPKESTLPESATASPSSKAEKPATSDHASLETEVAGRKYEAQQEKLLQHFEMLKQSPVQYLSAELNKVPKESKPLEEEITLPSSEPKESRPVVTNSTPVEPGAVGRKYEAQQEKLLQHFEMLKQSRVRRPLLSTAPAIRPSLSSESKIEQAASNGSVAPPASVRINDERDPNLTIARKAFLTVLVEHISNLNVAHKVFLNLLDKRVSVLRSAHGSAEIQQETVESASLYRAIHTQVPLAQAQKQSWVQHVSTEANIEQKESKQPEGSSVPLPSSSQPKTEKPAASDSSTVVSEAGTGHKYEAQQEKLLQHFEMLRQSPVRYPSAELNKVPKESKPLEEETTLPSSEPKESRPVATNGTPVEPGAVGRKYEAQQEKLLQHFEMLKRSQAQHVSSSPAAPATGASRATGGTDSAVSQSVESKPASAPKGRSIELNQHIIVRLQHESEQLRERLTVEDEEDLRSLSSTTQQNADIFGGSSDLPRTEAKPVPVPHEKVTVRPDIKQGQKKEPALPLMRTETLSFWDQARQWKDRSHGPVPLEKFKHYHPDFTLMNTSQLNWYFYWRSEVRSGRYPATDVGYIFIHAYEALGCIGFTNPAQACDRLFSLWKHYRESFADLDKYLIPWIADFCVVYTVPLTPMQWYIQVLAVPDCDIDAQLVAEAWLRQGGDWTQIPPAVLYKLTGFNTQTKFYQKMRQKHALDDGYKRAIAAVDNYLSSKFDRPALIARYGKGKRQAVEREPFKWALVEKPYAPITVAHINAAFTDAGFSQALSGILKYADHVQRKLYQSAVSPFAPTIDVNWQEAIEVVLTNKPSVQAKEPERQTVSKIVISASPQILPSAVPLDAEALEKLQEESDQLQERLTVGVGEGAVSLNTEAISRLRAESDQLQGRLTIEKEEDREEQSPQSISIPEVVPVVTPVIRNTSVSELEVDEEWKGIVQQWGPEHWEVIRLLHHAQHKELVLVERQTHRPVSRLIDEINSPVEEVLGDLLIDPDTKTIASHLQAIVETLLRTTHKSIKLVVERSEEELATPVRSNISVSKLEVSEGWKGIAQQWGPEHWEVIRLLHQGKQTDLTSVERRVHRPVSRLIDEVNSPVEEVLGDLLIDPDTRMIADHLQAILEVLLGWYRASKEK
ncbi:hypothetical protein KSD_77380 [Ktedonobacter sp. SOSP1-85]|uniref:TerB N-terminal domain-containing protein n=1 Tax=Ktedonobacter sp. SOSP1-85 TaxID=2778367 RepID=UPI001915D7BC|nr:TerB N-terminal domain-containing protein [Ktedonobacter sp. SOSP1-85]GHO79967.1 hypothetical protein KSD_77380 [Ktedonobacter sp. SOSP1-85]